MALEKVSRSRFQIDQRVVAGTFLARVLWLQGFPDQAMRTAEGNVEDANRPDLATIALRQNMKVISEKLTSNGTGNLFRPSRELNRAIREFIRRIRDSYVGRDFIAT